MAVVIGAGSVGLALAARLARAGHEVHVWTRRRAAARAIAAQGIRVDDPDTGESWRVKAHATTDPAELPLRDSRLPGFVCVRATDSEAVAAAAARACPDVWLASLQNDVDNEERMAEYAAHVLGGVWRHNVRRAGLARVILRSGGRIVVGLWPEGVGPEVRQVATVLREAGFRVGESEHIRCDLWLKLCANLLSAPRALVRYADQRTPVFLGFAAGLLEEARDALRAGGIEARSCDGRDRSLDEMIARLRAEARSPQPPAPGPRGPLRNSVFTALEEGGPLEPLRYHARIVELAAAHGRTAPRNGRVLLALERAQRESLGPERLSAAELAAAS